MWANCQHSRSSGASNATPSSSSSHHGDSQHRDIPESLHATKTAQKSGDKQQHGEKEEEGVWSESDSVSSGDYHVVSSCDSVYRSSRSHCIWAGSMDIRALLSLLQTHVVRPVCERVEQRRVAELVNKMGVLVTTNEKCEARNAALVVWSKRQLVPFWLRLIVKCETLCEEVNPTTRAKSNRQNIGIIHVRSMDCKVNNTTNVLQDKSEPEPVIALSSSSSRSTPSAALTEKVSGAD
eukprot:gene41531-51443_t